MPEVNMPRLSDTMQEGTITRWLKKPGDEVKKGDIIAEVETDKANMEVESYDAGVLEQILVNEGETAPIGQPIALIGSGAGAQASEQKQAAPTVAKGTAQEGQAQAAPVSPSSVQQASSAASASAQGQQARPQPTRNGVAASAEGTRIKVSPLARRIAEEHGIDLQQIQGTGPGGRIVRDDLEDFLEQQRAATPAPAATQAAPAQPAAQPAPAAAQPLPEDVEVVALSSMQKTIARRLTESKQTVPHFYVSNEIDMTEALALRQTLNSSAGEDGVKVSVNDLVVKACALALEKFPQVNSSYKDGQFLQHKHINIGIAVDIPNGLVVPVIHDANIKGVRTIAREARALIQKAQAGKLTTADLSGGTFSISNLGMMDVTEFVAIINPPESAILAVASARKMFVPIDGQPAIRDIMPLTISADHRVFYGAMAARFLQEVKRLLQNPYSLLG
jgi:pyruvate dehydrogenase E2 component (dihydrolipoamide acetyltransferase)